MQPQRRKTSSLPAATQQRPNAVGRSAGRGRGDFSNTISSGNTSKLQRTAVSSKTPADGKEEFTTKLTAGQTIKVLAANTVPLRKPGDGHIRLKASELQVLEDRLQELIHESEWLQNKNNELDAEAVRLRDATLALEALIPEVQSECDQLDAQAKTVKDEVLSAERHAAEETARRNSVLAMLAGERDALREDLAQCRGRASQLECARERLQQRIADAEVSSQRGSEEREQLRGELRMLEGERAVIASESEEAGRRALEHRSQAAALEQHVTKLSRVLDQEDLRLTEDRYTLKAAETKLGLEMDGERRRHESAVNDLPRQLEHESQEERRFEKIAQEWQWDVDACQAVREQLQDLQAKVKEQRHQRKQRLYEAQGQRDTLKATRLTVENQIKQADTEVQRLETWIKRVETQNTQIIASQIPLKNSYSQLVQQETNRKARKYLDAYPTSQPSSARGSSTQFGGLDPNLPLASSARAVGGKGNLIGSLSSENLELSLARLGVAGTARLS